MTQDVSDSATIEKSWRRLTRLAILDTCAWIASVALALTVASPDPAAERVGTLVGYALPAVVALLLLAHVLWTLAALRVRKMLVSRGIADMQAPVLLLLSLAFVFLAPAIVVFYTLGALKKDAAGPVFDSETGQRLQSGIERGSVLRRLAIAGVIVAVVAGAAGFGGSKLAEHAAGTYAARDAASEAIDALSSDLESIGDGVTSDDADASARLEEARGNLEDAEGLFGDATFFKADGYGEAQSLAEEGSEIIGDLSTFVADRDAAAARIENAEELIAKAKPAVEPKSEEAKEYATATEAYDAAVAAFGDGLYADKDGFGTALEQANTACATADQINLRVTSTFEAAKNAGSDWACYAAYLKFYTKYPHTEEAKTALSSARDIADKAVKADMDSMRDVLKHNAAWAKNPMDFQREGWVELPKIVEETTLDQYKECKNSIKSTKATKDLTKLNSALYEAAWAGNQFKKVVSRLERESTTSGNTVTYYYDDAMQRQMNDLCDKMRTNLNTAKDVLKGM